MLDEIQEGIMSKIYSVENFLKLPGEKLLTTRFGLNQSTKIRTIDDYAKSRLN